MMKLIVVLAVALCLAEAKLDGWAKFEHVMRNMVSNPFFRPMFDAHMKTWHEAEQKSKYHPEQAMASLIGCTGSPSPTVPTSVHALRPADIKVIAALGDSLTAANGADALTILGCWTEYRGTSWSIGGDRLSTDPSLPNIIRHFNPNLYGFAEGTGDRDSANKRFSVATAGAESRHMVEQANLLVQRLQSDANVDFNNDWKLVTLFIGGNDLCRFCNDEADFDATLFYWRVYDAINILYNNVPRALVQIVSTFDIGPLTEMGGLICSTVHIFACDCVRTAAGREAARLKTIEYQMELSRIASDAAFKQRGDFTVVLQPFFQDTEPPRNGDNLDTSFFAPDCFHFSRKGHHLSAISLWNQMFQPVGSKDTQWEENASVYCPHENEFIATDGN